MSKKTRHTPISDAAQIEGCELGSAVDSFYVPVEVARQLEELVYFLESLLENNRLYDLAPTETRFTSNGRK